MVAPLLKTLPFLAAAYAAELDLPNFSALNRRQDNSTSSSAGCSLDQTVAPGNLTLCGNATLFTTFRPKARFIAPEGWMNDPMGLYQRADGSIHAGYQSHPKHIQWGNISQGAAYSSDFTSWTDFNGSEGYKTIWPSQIYDIRGVFDGSIIKEGIDGYPTILYTSTSFGPLGATLNEAEGTETQSLAYTTDDGASWIKLGYGAGQNPVIYEWPETNLTGFRDPYVFQSPRLEALLANTTSITNATGDHFATISGGVHGDGARLFLYRQHTTGEFIKWTYLGPLVTTGYKESYGEWSGNYGINFETAGVTRLNPAGAAWDNGSDTTAVDFVTFGTEQGRADHQNHWPLWAAVDYEVRDNGSIEAVIAYSGVQDWGRSYAYASFPVEGYRQVSVGWIYEDDDNVILAKQFGYQGAFTLFRDLFVKVVENVSPSTPGLFEQASWSTKNSTDGMSVTVTTLGQRVVPETLAAYKGNSTVSTLAPVMLNESAAAYTPFSSQPTDRFYALTGSFEFGLNTTAKAGFRVLASEEEYTDIWFDPASENLTVVRTASSLIKSFGNDTELAKVKLYEIVGAESKTLNLTVFVDGSVIEIYANDEVALSTRAYPWLANSTGAGLLADGTTAGDVVGVSGLELWDGLVDAWPARPANTSQGLVWDGPTAAMYGLFAGY
uniref:Beta-fructofuranosidase n=1 Tax=Phaffia rhodozyma TaxID=264483 RepID=UPI0014612D87|nr:Chain A, Beta-fructofuranosidase [Phaffia rhodozyma]6S82_B Chain B, Beta-fructofuranosidase [Phaffia rhodozyma]